MPEHQKFKNTKIYQFCQNWTASADVLLKLEERNMQKDQWVFCWEGKDGCSSDQRISVYPFNVPSEKKEEHTQNINEKDDFIFSKNST